MPDMTVLILAAVCCVPLVALGVLLALSWLEDGMIAQASTPARSADSLGGSTNR
jgi:quinol-cytochrome oxidoreductase complex cytochrome b subunit